uniref:Alanine--glyoxylate aminotransferase 2, mitochondrial-like isoform X3 n=1 Tax=Petromyzon marinus TaxID=7757 RepID=A0AAJ7X292_PETMA|nr:alanine--glyoxylate aminotransferase 2, mitochondrial-like isoform X3 [Petromyzon marinus]
MCPLLRLHVSPRPCARVQVIEEGGTQAACSEDGLARFRDEFKVVGDVRGKGLMIGVELVTDMASRTPLPAAQMNEIWEDWSGKDGIYGQVFRIKPPMCIATAAVMHRALSNQCKRQAA